jgi:two-component sensor histidine kinase
MIGALIAIAIAIAAVLLVNSLRKQRETNDEFRRDFQIVLELRRTESLLTDAETGQRGFLLTSNPAFLAPYARAKSLLPGAFRQLDSVGLSRPGGKLESLGNAKLQELETTLALAQSGRRDTALALVSSGRGKLYMDGIRAEVAQLLARQEAQIATAIEQSEKYASRTFWALALLIASTLALVWLGFSMIIRTQRLEAEAVRLREVEEAERRTALIARELNHRVKNLFSVILAIVQLASRGAATPKEAVGRVRERVQALARAHEISLGSDPMSGFDLEALLKVTLAPYASRSAELDLKGPAVHLPAMRATPLGLIVHELATNAVKYGAWSGEGGKVTVRWSVEGTPQLNGSPAAHLLRLHWNEERHQPIEADGSSGFGSQLINAAVAQLDGTLARERGNNGISIVIDAPIIQV